MKSGIPKQNHFAHSLKGRPHAEWQLLAEHLTQVASRAAQNASAFDAGEWGRLAGLWHDLGKYSDAFQEYLKRASGDDAHIAECSEKVDHSSAGAQHAVARFPILGHLIGYAIAGHHSGLHDGRSHLACLESRLLKQVAPWRDNAPAEIIENDELRPPEFLRQVLSRIHLEKSKTSFSLSFFTRMLFSSLVDADFLDTEAFLSEEKSLARPVWPDDILHQMERHLDRFVLRLPSAATPVDSQRHSVRSACLEAASLEPGLFSLTVPTGGGKTLSSLAFALRHARTHNLRRVIYVVPFTTIIEQNADQFRQALGPLMGTGGADLVIEHHSNVSLEEHETSSTRLATENWDAPLIVTTSVQFYESLFANRTSRCRKLHNLARSVVILDEVQTLPVDLLEPCLRALSELADHYRTTIVLCTATQPAILKRDNFPAGLEKVREIIAHPGRLQLALSRVEVQQLGPLTDTALAQQIDSVPQSLTIVNTRDHARRLFEVVGTGEGRYHLSALMCPRHRSAALKTIRSRLDAGQSCQVISTQLIEAGVDIDFPVVFRSLAGLDSIAQAAGRCNRNGRLTKKGVTYVFESEQGDGERFFAETTNVARQLLPLFDDPLCLEAIEHYFRQYYWEQADRWDAHKILSSFRVLQDRQLPFSFKFATVAREFRLISDVQKPVIIPWDRSGRELCRRLQNPRLPPSRRLLRQLQSYTVQLYPNQWQRLAERGALELAHQTYPILSNPEHDYCEQTGLQVDIETLPFLHT